MPERKSRAVLVLTLLAILVAFAGCRTDYEVERTKLPGIDSGAPAKEVAK